MRYTEKPRIKGNRGKLSLTNRVPSAITDIVDGGFFAFREFVLPFHSGAGFALVMRVLITIDEATSTPRMREFAAQFQIYLRKDYNIFLLMTGLYENVNELQNEKALTFLYRAPKMVMLPLSATMIAEKYASVFHLSQKEAAEMAKATKGYAYAFQLLGYLCFKRKRPYTEVMTEYDAALEQYIYEKMWSELSQTDQTVLCAMASTSETKVEKIREAADMTSSSFSVYRNRLKKRGLIRQTKYAHVDFSLPRFREFVRRMEE